MTNLEPGYLLLADALNPLLAVAINLEALAEVYPEEKQIKAAQATLARLGERLDMCVTLWMAEHGQRRVTRAELDALFGVAS